MIVDNYNIEAERSLLRQCTLDGIGHGADTIAHGDNHRRFNRPASGEVDLAELGFKPRANGLEVLGTGLLHLDLHGAIARINIVKLRTTAGHTLRGVEQLGTMHHFTLTRQGKPQSIERSIVIVTLNRSQRAFKRTRVNEHQMPEIEIVTKHSATAAVNEPMRRQQTVAPLVVVGVDNRCAGHARHLTHTMQRIVRQMHRHAATHNEYIFVNLPDKRHNGLGRAQKIQFNHNTQIYEKIFMIQAGARSFS